MNPEDQFKQEIAELEEIHNRMIKAGLLVKHGHSDKTKRIAAEFTPDGQEVVTTIYTLHKTIGPLTPKQVVLFWKYMVAFADARMKDSGQNPA